MENADYIISLGPGSREDFLKHLEREHEQHYFAAVAYRQCLDIVSDCTTYAEARTLIGQLLDSSMKVVSSSGECDHAIAAHAMRQVYQSIMRSLHATIVQSDKLVIG
jgi:hypothetical protein